MVVTEPTRPFQACKHVFVNRVYALWIGIGRTAELIALRIHCLQVFLRGCRIDVNKGITGAVSQPVPPYSKIATKCRIKITYQIILARRSRANRARSAVRILFALDGHNPNSLRCLASPAGAPRSGSGR